MTGTRAIVAPMRLAVDPVLMLMGLALLLVGLVAITSASIEYADFHYRTPWYHSIRQIIYITLGVVTAYAVYRVPLEFWLNTGSLKTSTKSFLILWTGSQTLRNSEFFRSCGPSIVPISPLKNG